jgi:hypothetical protein
MKIITTHPVYTEASPLAPQNEYWDNIDGSNDLQVRHFQHWSNAKKSAGLKVNGKLNNKSKNAYAAYGSEWEKDYKKAYPNLSTTNPSGVKQDGKLWDSVKNQFVNARDSGLLQQGLDALGLKYTLPTAPESNLSTGSEPANLIEPEGQKEDKNSSKTFVTIALTAGVIIGGFFLLKTFKVKK